MKGYDLVPQEVTDLLGRDPDSAQRKGNPLYRSDGTLMRIPTLGAWWARMKREETDEWDCCEAIAELLATMKQDVDVWSRLGAKYEVAVRVGLSLPFSGAGFEFPPRLLSYLSARGISVGFEVYADESKTANKAPEPTPGAVTPRATEGASK